MPKLKSLTNPKTKNLNKKYKKVITKLKKIEGVEKMPLLVIIVGESGTGKSTFCKVMDCKENWYVSSKPLEEILKKQNKSINHDTIHSLANKLYSENPIWQVNKILKTMKGKDFLLLDGPRRIKEVEKLIEKHKATLIIQIKTNKNKRFKRLKTRDNVKNNDFKRIVKDEKEQTELKKILEKALITIVNDGSLVEFKKQAKQFRYFLLNFRKYL